MLGHTPPGPEAGIPPGPEAGTPPDTVHAVRYGKQVGGTHPTGMQSSVLRFTGQERLIRTRLIRSTGQEWLIRTRLIRSST